MDSPRSDFSGYGTDNTTRAFRNSHRGDGRSRSRGVPVQSDSASSSAAQPSFAPIVQAVTGRRPEVASGSPLAPLTVSLNPETELDRRYSGVKIVRETFGREVASLTPPNVKSFLTQSGLPDEMGILVHRTGTGQLDMPPYAVPDCDPDRMDTVRAYEVGYTHKHTDD